MNSSYNGRGRANADLTVEGLGDRIKAFRKEHDLGLNEAARRCKIAPQKLADAEAGKDSRASTVAAIARGLGVSADYLLGLVPVNELPASPRGALEDLVEETAEEVGAILGVLEMIATALANSEVDRAVHDIRRRFPRT